MSSPPPPCPLCGQGLTEARAINVCHTCHSTVVADGVKVSATGEFRVEQIMAAMDGETAETAAIQNTLDGEGVRCSWCSKGADEVRKLLSRGQAHICNECVALCAQIMSAELGDDY